MYKTLAGAPMTFPLKIKNFPKILFIVPTLNNENNQVRNTKIVLQGCKWSNYLQHFNSRKSTWYRTAYQVRTK